MTGAPCDVAAKGVVDEDDPDDSVDAVVLHRWATTKLGLVRCRFNVDALEDKNDDVQFGILFHRDKDTAFMVMPL